MIRGLQLMIGGLQLMIRGLQLVTVSLRLLKGSLGAFPGFKNRLTEVRILVIPLDISDEKDYQEKGRKRDGDTSKKEIWRNLY